MTDHTHRPDTSDPTGRACLCGGDTRHHHEPDHQGCPDWCPRAHPYTASDYLRATAQAVGVDPATVETP